MMRRRLLCSFLVFLSALLIFTPVFAATESISDKFAENNILFYNPDGQNCISFAGDVAIYGSTAAQKVWTGLRSVNVGGQQLTAEQVAGIMGNMAHEGNYFNPVQWEIPFATGFDYFNDTGGVNGSGGGFGLIQWSFGRRVNILNYIISHDPSLRPYIEDYQTYSDGYRITGEKFIELAGEDVADRFYALEIQFLADELSTNEWYRQVLSQTSVDTATHIFLKNVEVPSTHEGTRPYLSLAEAQANWSTRFQDAHGFYNQFSNLAVGGSSVESDGSNVTLIGDSISVGSINQIKALMPNIDVGPSVGDNNSYIQVSKHFAAGSGDNPGGFTILDNLLQNNRLRDVVIYALGTNDQGTLTAQTVNEVISKAGSSRQVIFVTNYGALDKGYDFSSNNNALRGAANNTSVFIADWDAGVSADPGKYISSDGIHPTADGTALFAQILHDTVTQKTSGNQINDLCGGAHGSLNISLDGINSDGLPDPPDQLQNQYWTPRARAVARIMYHLFKDDFYSIMTYGSSSTREERGTGSCHAPEAIDMMITDYTNPTVRARHEQIAEWIMANRTTLGVTTIIYYDKINSMRTEDEQLTSFNQWRSYTSSDSRGINDTTQHRDHIHISIEPCRN
jgi:lysophospholipase L1-like esterase